jgi:hypothetical protein
MYFVQDQTTTPHNMPHQRSAYLSCKARNFLLRDIRPTPNSQSQYLLRKADLCPIQCIYCDIWKLALLVASRQNQSQSKNTPTSPSPQQRYYSSSSPSSPSSTTKYEEALKSIESGHHLQRARLSSIISICTAEGAEESEGLRIAHGRCLSAVFELIRQERAVHRQIQLQGEREERESRDRDREIREWRERDCGNRAMWSNANQHYGERRRGSSVVSCAT